jgi:hypothetical protein
MTSEAFDALAAFDLMKYKDGERVAYRSNDNRQVYIPDVQEYYYDHPDPIVLTFSAWGEGRKLSFGLDYAKETLRMYPGGKKVALGDRRFSDLHALNLPKKVTTFAAPPVYYDPIKNAWVGDLL